MFDKIKNNEYKVVLKNFLNLALVQGIALLLPLITTPYIIRKIGLENVGLVAFASSVIAYFGVLINYGFNLTATKDIAQNVISKQRLNEIFCDVTYAKILLSTISLLFFFILLFFVKLIQENFILYFSLLLSVIFTNLSPEWFFQGVQKMQFITRVNLILKVLATVLTFMLVKKTSDYFYLGLIPCINGFFLFIVTQFYIYKVYKVKYHSFKIIRIFNELDKGKYIFLSQIKITFFNNFNILILGIVTNDFFVGVFSSADKIIKVFSSVQVPVVSALFPYFASKVRDNKRKAWKELNKIAIYGFCIYTFCMFLVFSFSEKIAIVMFGTAITEISILIKIMSIIPVLVFLNNLYGTQYLLNAQKDKIFLRILIKAAILNTIMIFPFTYYFQAVGTSFSVLITELFVLFAMYFASKKIYKISLKNEG